MKLRMISLGVASALATVACGGGGGQDSMVAPSRLSGANPPATVEAPPGSTAPPPDGSAPTSQVLAAKRIHTLTPATGQLAQKLRAEGWQFVAVSATQLADASIEVLYVDVESEEAQSEALHDQLASETRPVLFDSRTPAEGSVIYDVEGKAFLTPNPDKVDRITPLGSYLARLTGLGTNASAVLIKEGEELPFFVDVGGTVNGQAASQSLGATALGAFLDRTERLKRQGTTLAAENGGSGTLVLTPLADKPRARRSRLLSAAGDGESRVTAKWEVVSPRENAVIGVERALRWEGWGNIRIAGKHRVSVHNQYVGPGPERPSVRVEQITSKDGTAHYAEGVEAGHYIIGGDTNDRLRYFPDGTALAGPYFQAFINGVYAGGGGTGWQRLSRFPADIDDTSVPEEVVSSARGTSWATGPSASFSVFGLFNAGWNGSVGGSNSVTTIKKTRKYQMSYRDLQPVGIEYDVHIKNNHPASFGAGECSLNHSGGNWARCGSTSYFDKFPAMLHRGWAPNIGIEFAPTDIGCHVRQVNVVSYQGADLVEYRYRERNFTDYNISRNRLTNMAYWHNWDADSPRMRPKIAAFHFTVNLPRRGC